MADSLSAKVNKLLDYGNSQLSQQGITEPQTTIRGVLDKVSEIRMTEDDIDMNLLTAEINKLLGVYTEEEEDANI